MMIMKANHNPYHYHPSSSSSLFLFKPKPYHRHQSSRKLLIVSKCSILNPKQSKPTVTIIGGIPVEFPFPPYPTQLLYMSLDRAQRDRHFHALLGGKTLSLLCSLLAWHKNYCTSNSHSNPHQEDGLIDPIGYGANLMPTPSETNIVNKRRKITIYYATRTHAQITQVIGEFRKTSYRVPMAVLASKKHYCTNPKVRGQDNIDEKCKGLLKEMKERKVGCREAPNTERILAYPSLWKGGCYEVHDVGDLVKVGELVEGCAYYAARHLAEVADIIFCSYSYIIDPQIRKRMHIKLTGNIVILDEAHNIEDMSREVASIDVEEGVLFQILKELKSLRKIDRVIYQPLCEMIEGILSWISRRKTSLGKHSSQLKASSWSGDKALEELEEATISRHSKKLQKQTQMLST